MKLRKLEIFGFRSFGREKQELVFRGPLSVVYGHNSQGKTSLAEAAEFLLTGGIVRRELMASTQDEFADSLRNAHLDPQATVYVEATILGNDQKQHTVRRTLVTDYTKRQDCQTELSIDGLPATKEDLVALGTVLSLPPLSAPIIAHHTLSYLFSARPQDRADYFRAVLEVQNLEEFRRGVSAIGEGLKEPKSDLRALLDTAERNLQIALALLPLTVGAPPSAEAILASLHEAMGGLLPPDARDVEDTVAAFSAELERRRSLAFPVDGFEADSPPIFDIALDSEWETVEEFLSERRKVDEKTQEVMGLFQAAIELPHLTHDVDADCPLCAAHGTLTPERVTFIRMQVENSSALTEAASRMSNLITAIRRVFQSVERDGRSSLPSFLRWSPGQRRIRGFIASRIRDLIGPDKGGLVRSWTAELRGLRVAFAQLNARRAAAERALDAIVPKSAPGETFETLRRALADVERAVGRYREAVERYGRVEADLKTALLVLVDQASATQGWAELIELTNHIPALQVALVDKYAYKLLSEELASALRQIDRGNENVLDEKFKLLSGAVGAWWDRLRPDEMSYFTGVQQRPNSRRTIDFKAGLATQPDRSDVKLRNVIAVFSQSQLHCLGLSLFLARTIADGGGFMVMDDPILSSDDDYRSHFNTAVLEELAKLGVQVILLTQDQKTAKDLADRYLHLGIDTMELAVASPRDGTIVTDTADDLASMLTRAEILVRGAHRDNRKKGGEILRDAGERFCKEMLVRDRRQRGDGKASLLNYDKKNLSDLSPLVEPLLTADPGHPGKLRAVGRDTNPANHDDDAPASGVLRVTLGDLKMLRKTYLR